MPITIDRLPTADGGANVIGVRGGPGGDQPLPPPIGIMPAGSNCQRGGAVANAPVAPKP